jgi:uncharacterized membrane protein YhaH (DUF805 family)
MRALRLLFSPSGRLLQRSFVVAATAVYIAGAASQLLTRPSIMVRGGLWAFAAAQVLLIWVWFSLHAKRLRDAGRPTGLALGASLLYALSVVLLLIMAGAFFGGSTAGTTDANTTSALGLLMVLTIGAALLGEAHFDFVWLIIAILTVLAILPIVIALVVTIWAAARPSAKAPVP